MHDDDRTRGEWQDLMWLKFEQRRDVEEPLAELSNRRAAEAERFDEAAASLQGERRLRVVAVGYPTLEERLAHAGRVRFLGADPVSGTQRWETPRGTELRAADGSLIDRQEF